MSSNTSAERREDRSAPYAIKDFNAGFAPSVIVEDEPTLARYIGFVGAGLLLAGAVALISRLSFGRNVIVGPTAGVLMVVVGLASLLFHAALDREVQFRRVYLFAGGLAVAIGAFLGVLPYPTAVGDLFGAGFLFMVVGLLFLLAPLRHETDLQFRQAVVTFLAVAGTLMAAIGLGGGMMKFSFLLPYGLLLAALGVVYLAVFVSARGTSDDLAYRVGRVIGYVGLAIFVLAAVRSLYPPIAAWWRGTAAGGPQDYLVGGGGLLLMALGLLYFAVSVGLCSDRPFVVLTRRELGAFFYSPIAYFVLIGFVLAAGINFVSFISGILQFQEEARRGMAEPIVRNYFVNLWPVITVLIAVPVLTMRLLSEEHRTGTLEVMLTAPVEETTVVLSKFTAALLMFLTVCVPFGLLLLVLRLFGGKPFDARPLLAFLVGLIATGAGFVGLGLLCSALTRNQVAAAVLTFVALLGMLFVYILKFLLPAMAAPIWSALLTHISFLDVWVTTLEGKIQPNLFLFHVSLAAVCLFLTVKWLESRKWR